MDSDTLAVIKSTIEESVKVNVNGKIDDLTRLVTEHNERHEADMVLVRDHMEETKPILEAYKGFNSAGNLVKWVAGVGTAVAGLWYMFMQLIKNI